MNRIPHDKRVQILSMLVEGSSMRSISRVVGVSINTVTKMLVDAGEACGAYHDATVRDVKAARVQCDEIWTFCYAKQRNVRKAKAAPLDAGDVWTWTALDADSNNVNNGAFIFSLHHSRRRSRPAGGGGWLRVPPSRQPSPPS